MRAEDGQHWKHHHALQLHEGRDGGREEDGGKGGRLHHQVPQGFHYYREYRFMFQPVLKTPSKVYKINFAQL